MAVKPNVKPINEEVTFADEGIDAKALITRTDKKGIITFASKPYRDMTKYSRDELIGKPHNIVRHPCMPEAAFKEMWDMILDARKWMGLVKNLRKDGKYYWVMVEIQGIDNNGNAVSNPDDIEGFLAIRREASRDDIKKAEEHYKIMRKAELLDKKRRGVIKEWEEEVFKNL